MEKYLEPIINFLENNDWSVEEDEFIGLQYDIVDEMETDKVGFEITQNILELMEKNPLVEFGSPGPLTHFIEKFHNDNQEQYQEILKKSVSKKPTVHTVWLLNRIINGTEGKTKMELTQIMITISKNLNLNSEIRAVAELFLK